MDNIIDRNSVRNQEVSHTSEISVCIVSNQLNEKLEEIINAAYSFAKEILIGYDGDMSSIPQGFNSEGKAIIVPVIWKGFSATKNALADKASASWILSLDADEVPDKQLIDEIIKLPFTSLPQNQVFSLKRISFFEGNKITHGAWGQDRVLRLYHRGYTQWDAAVVHENLTRKGDTEIVMLPGILYHYTADDYDVFLAKNKNYARLSAVKYFETGKKSPLWKRLFSPAFTFVKEYIFQGGFLDGNAGFQIAKANTLYTYWKYIYLKEKYQN